MDSPLFLKVKSGYFVEVTNYGIHLSINLANVTEVVEVNNTCLEVNYVDGKKRLLGEYASQQLKIYLHNLSEVFLPSQIDPMDR